jgi:hypothetical protein
VDSTWPPLSRGNELHQAGIISGLILFLAGQLSCGTGRFPVIEEGEYEGRPQFIVQTENATWYFDRQGGGFSRLIDSDGNDWIAFSKNPLNSFPESAAAGYRGIPNAVFMGPDKGAGHPGFDQCRSEIDGVNTIRSETLSGRWAWRWDFSNDSARFTMERADPEQKWWFLYEGPVAGSFDPSRKFWGTDKGGPSFDTPTINDQKFDRWRWAYFGDRYFKRILLVIQHSKDNLEDNLWFLGSTENGSICSSDGMIVFGFGRGPGTKPLFSGGGQSFTILFKDLFSDPLSESGWPNQATHQAVLEFVEEVLVSVLSQQ